jgi:predicted nucleic acid-binding protein
LNRPFDDLTQDRVRMEAEAVLTILKQVTGGAHVLVSSDAVEIEIAQDPDTERASMVLSSADTASIHVAFDENIQERAHVLENANIYGYDALHLACAEVAKVDVFFKTDDDLIKSYRKVTPKPKMPMINPLAWISEVL